jgi:hypothetical protein
MTSIGLLLAVREPGSGSYASKVQKFLQDVQESNGTRLEEDVSFRIVPPASRQGTVRDNKQEPPTRLPPVDG